MHSPYLSYTLHRQSKTLDTAAIFSLWPLRRTFFSFFRNVKKGIILDKHFLPANLIVMSCMLTRTPTRRGPRGQVFLALPHEGWGGQVDHLQGCGCSRRTGVICIDKAVKRTSSSCMVMDADLEEREGRTGGLLCFSATLHYHFKVRKS